MTWRAEQTHFLDGSSSPECIAGQSKPFPARYAISFLSLSSYSGPVKTISRPACEFCLDRVFATFSHSLHSKSFSASCARLMCSFKCPLLFARSFGSSACLLYENAILIP